MGDPRQIVIIQVIRLLMLTVFVPIGALFLPLGPYVAAAGRRRSRSPGSPG